MFKNINNSNFHHLCLTEIKIKRKQKIKSILLKICHFLKDSWTHSGSSSPSNTI
jgi:hypothetical protein